LIFLQRWCLLDLVFCRNQVAAAHARVGAAGVSPFALAAPA